VTIFASTLDITALKEAEEALAQQAMHDSLTGLPNRRLLFDRIVGAQQRLRRHPGSVAVMFLDLDRFKLVNDLLGHDAGDELLVEISTRLSNTLRASDTVARLGGDEFVVLLEGVESRDDLAAIASTIVDAVEQPIVFGNGEMSVSASIGIAISRACDADPDALLRQADAAMYRAKSLGRARFEFHDDSGAAPGPARHTTNRSRGTSTRQRH